MGILVVISALFSGCQSHQFDTEIATIDSLQTQLDSSATMLDKIDSVELANRQDSVQKSLLYLSSYFKNSRDTLMGPLSEKIARYRESAKAKDRILDTRKELLSQIEYSHKQLSDLKHDLSHGLQTREAADQNLLNEKRTAEGTISTTTLLQRTDQLTRQQYIENKVVVDSLINTIKQKTRVH